MQSGHPRTAINKQHREAKHASEQEAHIGHLVHVLLPGFGLGSPHVMNLILCGGIGEGKREVLAPVVVHGRASGIIYHKAHAEHILRSTMVPALNAQTCAVAQTGAVLIMHSCARASSRLNMSCTGDLVTASMMCSVLDSKSCAVLVVVHSCTSSVIHKKRNSPDCKSAGQASCSCCDCAAQHPYQANTDISCTGIC